MDQLNTLKELLWRHAEEPFCSTSITGLSLMRSNAVSSCMIAAMYSPMVCIIAQGKKQVIAGDTTLDYNVGKYLVSSVNLPVSAMVTKATSEHPYLALSLELDPRLLASVLLDLPRSDPRQPLHCGVAVSPNPPALLEAFVRLLRLLDSPDDIAHLAPLALREICYRLLTGERSAMLRQMALPQSRLPQVLRAIGWIRHNYAKPLHIASLARLTNMSAASLHRQFKAVTSMSPLQYQKQVRLQEARQILVSKSIDAASAGYAVGYGSPSQFSREYSRMFGIPPKRHLRQVQSQDQSTR